MARELGEAVAQPITTTAVTHRRHCLKGHELALFEDDDEWTCSVCRGDCGVEGSGTPPHLRRKRWACKTELSNDPDECVCACVGIHAVEDCDYDVTGGDSNHGCGGLQIVSTNMRAREPARTHALMHARRSRRCALFAMEPRKRLQGR